MGQVFGIRLGISALLLLLTDFIAANHIRTLAYSTSDPSGPEIAEVFPMGCT